MREKSKFKIYPENPLEGSDSLVEVEEIGEFSITCIPYAILEIY